MFPYAVLIGAMLSLGAMASDLEFVSMQAAGISVSKIMFTILSQVFVLSIFFVMLLLCWCWCGMWFSFIAFCFFGR